MNIYLIIEDGEQFCFAADNMTQALDKARGVYIEERRNEVLKKDPEDYFDHGGELEHYEQQILESCSLVGELANHVEDGSELQRTMAAIDELTADEANMVTIVSDNADFDGPNSMIYCKGDWTNFEEIPFTGDSRLKCLQAAVKARFMYLVGRGKAKV